MPATLLLDRVRAEGADLWRGLRQALSGRRRAVAREWEQAAEDGDPEYQYRMGVVLEMGGARDAANASAADWYRRAAERGHAGAQHNLGYLYRHGGEGVEKDPAAAADWYRLAARQGVPDAQHALGEMYAAGEGVARDPAEARRWLAAAIAAYPPDARRDLARRALVRLEAAAE